MNTADKEKWRTIPEFPNYVISNKGRIANKKGYLMTINEDSVRLSRANWKGNRGVKKMMKQIWPE